MLAIICSLTMSEWKRCTESTGTQIVELLIVNSSLLRELREDGAGRTLLTQEDHKEILECKSARDKAEALLTKLSRKRPSNGTIRKFCGALQATGQKRLSQIMDESLKQEYGRRLLMYSVVVNEPDSS